MAGEFICITPPDLYFGVILVPTGGATFVENALSLSNSVTLVSASPNPAVSPSSLNFGSLQATIPTFIEAELNTTDQVTLISTALSVSPTYLNFGFLGAGVAGTTFIENTLNASDQIFAVINPILVDDQLTPSDQIILVSSIQNTIPTFIEAELNTTDQVTLISTTLKVTPTSLNFGSLQAGGTIYAESASGANDGIIASGTSSFAEGALNPSEISTSSSGIQIFSDSTTPSDQVVAGTIFAEPALNPSDSLNASSVQTLSDDAITTALDSITLSGQQALSDTNSSLSDLFYLQALTLILSGEESLNASDSITVVSLPPQMLDMASSANESVIGSSVVAWTDNANAQDQFIQVELIPEPALNPSENAVVASTQNITEAITGANEDYTLNETQVLADTASLSDQVEQVPQVVNVSEVLTPSESETQSGTYNLFDFLAASELVIFTGLAELDDQDANASDTTSPSVSSQNVNEPLTLIPVDVVSALSVQTMPDSSTASEQVLVYSGVASISENQATTNENMQSGSVLGFQEGASGLVDSTTWNSTLGYVDATSQASDSITPPNGNYSPFESALGASDEVWYVSAVFIDPEATPSDSAVSDGAYAMTEPAINGEFDSIKFIVDLSSLTNYALVNFVFRGGYGYNTPIPRSEDISPWYVNQTDPPMLGVLRSDSGRPINLDMVAQLTLIIRPPQGDDRVGTGEFQVVKASQGIVVYFWGVDDVSEPGNFSLQLLTEGANGVDKSDPVEWNVISI